MDQNEDRVLKVGDHVKFVNEHGILQDALVINPWAAEGVPSGAINLVTLSTNEDKKDDCGRQTEKFCSVSHRMHTTVPGRYWYKA